MVRLENLRSFKYMAGTTPVLIPPSGLTDKYRLAVYRLRAQQRGATLNTLFLYRRLGATMSEGQVTISELPVTLDEIRFAVLDDIVDTGPVTKDSLPLYQPLGRASAQYVAASIDVASVDLLIEYAEEYTGSSQTILT